MSADRETSNPAPRRWRGLYHRLALPLVDAVFPADCFVCERRLLERQRLGACASCWAGLQLLAPSTCPGCALPVPPESTATGPARGRCVSCVGLDRGYAAVRALFVYDELARRFLLRAKLGRRPELLVPFGQQLARAIQVTGFARGATLVVPVPSHPWATLVRGFSPANELARPVAQRLGLPLARKLHRCLSAPRSSKRLSARRRRATSYRAFRVRGRLEGARVLLIDDVMTTGATLESCAMAARQAGASVVLAAAWARALER